MKTQEIEDRLEYTPEKIDEYINSITQINSTFVKYYEKTFNMILTLTISEFVHNFEGMVNRLELMKESKDKINVKYIFYYNIVDRYGSDQPRNVYVLEKLTWKLDSIMEDFNDLISVMEDLINSAKILKRNENINK